MSHELTPRRAAGIDLLVRDGEADRTIVLLHGIGGRASSFAEAMRRWPAGPRLIAWDQPGYGNSEPHSSAWPTASDYGNTLARVLDALDLRSVDLLGQSLGALIAATFAFQQPSRVKRLALVSPAHGYDVPVGGPLTPALAQRIADFQREGAAAFADKRAPRLVFEPERKPAVTRIVRDTMATLTEPGHTQAVNVLASGDIETALDKITHAIFFYSGTQDVVTPHNATRALFEAASRSRHRDTIATRMGFIPNAGHALYLEEPAIFASTLSGYFGGAS